MDNHDGIRVHDLGFVRLVDSMGGDSAIVQAARVSYGAGTKTLREDSQLIGYLLRNNHGTPFEMVSFKFHVKAPIFVARQWFRHRISSYNEESGRYSVLKPEFYMPELGDLAVQDTKNRQGRAGALEPRLGAEVLMRLAASYQQAYDCYRLSLESGLSREQARIVLPVATYTSFYWAVNLRALFNFLSLRCDGHAQAEIRAYAFAVLDLIGPIAPVAVEVLRQMHGEGWVRP